MLRKFWNSVIELTVMKRKCFVCPLLVLFMLAGGCGSADQVIIDETPVFFGDNEPFYNVCIERYDVDGDGILTRYECSLVKEMDVSNLNLFSLEGISNFTNLERLFCYGNVLSVLDLSSMKELKYLYCNNSNIHELDVSGCGELLILDAHYNYLEEVDISSCRKIFLLSVCFNPRLDELNLAGASNLGTLYCQSCALTKLDVSACNLLEGLHCWGNSITELNLDGCSNLTDLWCGDNDLYTVDVSSCPDMMEYISCPRNNRMTRLYMRQGQTAASIELPAHAAIINK